MVLLLLSRESTKQSRGPQGEPTGRDGRGRRRARGCWVGELGWVGRGGGGEEGAPGGGVEVRSGWRRRGRGGLKEAGKQAAEVAESRGEALSRREVGTRRW